MWVHYLGGTSSKGRQRQFHQFGVEAFGSENPEQDVEIISIAWHLLSLLGIMIKFS